MIQNALIHDEEDDVAVVIQDVAVDVPTRILTLDGKEVGLVAAREDIPLGHKIAVRDLDKGKEIKEYGRPIGRASRQIPKGNHVHTHNLKSIRWGK